MDYKDQIVRLVWELRRKALLSQLRDITNKGEGYGYLLEALEDLTERAADRLEVRF